MSGGLDALFGPAEEQPAPEPVEPAPPRQRSWIGFAIRNVLLIGIATVVTVAGLGMAGVRVSLLIIVSAFIALRLLMLAVAAVAPPPLLVGTTQVRGEEPGEYQWGGTDSLRVAVRRWEMRLDWSQSDADRFSRNVLPVLAELTDERLRLRHGITRASDPQRARELIGDPLWRLLDEPGRRPPKRAELATHVEALEKL